MIYQESVMRVAQKFAGYSLAEADNLRKACGKKIRALIAAEREKFVDGCVRTGYGAELGTQLFDIIEPFADYAFNKSHSYGYGFIAYQTAYLKAHYPVEYIACLLTSVKANLDKAAVYLAECRAMGVRVLNPDINLSASDFIALDPEDAPAGVELPPGCPGVDPVRAVGGAQRGRGPGRAGDPGAGEERPVPATSTTSSTASTSAVLNKRTVESLIKAGAFDSLGHTRKGLLLAYELIIDQSVARRRKRGRGPVRPVRGAGERRRPDHDRIDDPDVEFAKAERLALREGDARPLRQRPPAAGRRAGAAAQVRRHRGRAPRA